MSTPACYLLVISEREALAWILRESRMAFSATTRGMDRLNVGDDLYLTTTRGCFHNPTRDRTRIIGHAAVTSPVESLRRPVELVGRVFPYGCDLAIDSLTPYLSGVELGPLIDRLDAFPNKDAWSIWMRRTLLPLTRGDRQRLRRALAKVADVPGVYLDGYLTAIRPVATESHPRHR